MAKNRCEYARKFDSAQKCLLVIVRGNNAGKYLHRALNVVAAYALLLALCFVSLNYV